MKTTSSSRHVAQTDLPAFQFGPDDPSKPAPTLPVPDGFTMGEVPSMESLKPTAAAHVGHFAAHANRSQDPVCGNNDLPAFQYGPDDPSKPAPTLPDPGFQFGSVPTGV